MRNLLCILALAPAALADDTVPKPPSNPVVVITTSMGEIRVRLFRDEAPKTVENFIALAEGTKEWKDQKGETVKKPFYDGLVFHRVIPNFMIQGGCPKGDGSGDAGYKFDDEISAKALGLDTAKAYERGKQPHPSLHIQAEADLWPNLYGPLMAKMGIKSQAELDQRKDEVDKKMKALTAKEALENLGYTYDDSRPSHEPKKGVIAMANSGPNTNGSQFFINLADTPWLAGRHTVFGEVIQGMDVVEKIGAVRTGADARPIQDVKIVSIRLAPPEAPKPADAPKPPEPAPPAK